jgi:hypothetical protein
MVFNHEVIFSGTVAAAADRLRGLSNVAGSLTAGEGYTVRVAGICDICHGASPHSVISITSGEFRGRLRI